MAHCRLVKTDNFPLIVQEFAPVTPKAGAHYSLLFAATSMPQTVRTSGLDETQTDRETQHESLVFLFFIFGSVEAHRII